MAFGMLRTSTTAPYYGGFYRVGAAGAWTPMGRAATTPGAGEALSNANSVVRTPEGRLFAASNGSNNPPVQDPAVVLWTGTGWRNVSPPAPTGNRTVAFELTADIAGRPCVSQSWTTWTTSVEGGQLACWTGAGWTTRVALHKGYTGPNPLPFANHFAGRVNRVAFGPGSDALLLTNNAVGALRFDGTMWRSASHGGAGTVLGVDGAGRMMATTQNVGGLSSSQADTVTKQHAGTVSQGFVRWRGTYWEPMPRLPADVAYTCLLYTSPSPRD